MKSFSNLRNTSINVNDYQSLDLQFGGRCISVNYVITNKVLNVVTHGSEMTVATVSAVSRSF